MASAASILWRTDEAAPCPEGGVGVAGPIPRADRRSGAEAGNPEEQRVVIRDEIRPPPGRDHRNVQELGEARELGRGPGAEDPAAGQDDRMLSGREEFD